MKAFRTAAALLACTACSQPTAAPTPSTNAIETMSLYQIHAAPLDGSPADLAAMRGTVSLVVNVASACGLTPQYAGLQRLHDELKGRGFSVLAFPSNDFGAQEPGDAAQIRTFCTTKYAVTFPMFAKVQTKAGPGQSPVYAFLQRATGALPEWNFGKYLVGRDGTVLRYFAPTTAPDDAQLRAAIDAALR